MSVDFGRACGDLFTTEKKWITLLCLTVCLLIPIVGQMVVVGYVLRRAARVRNGKSAEDFDFQYFAEYLKLGLWPVLASLALAVVLVPAFFLFLLAPMLAIPTAEEAGDIAAALVFLAGFLVYCGIVVAYSLVSFPVMLRSGLMVQFQAGFLVRFILDFLRRVGWSLLLYFLLFMLIALPLTLVGYLAIFVGVYVVGTWVQYTMMQLLFQHYDLYLERGGEPIEVHVDLTREYGVPPLPPQTGAGDVT